MGGGGEGEPDKLQEVEEVVKKRDEDAADAHAAYNFSFQSERVTGKKKKEKGCGHSRRVRAAWSGMKK